MSNQSNSMTMMVIGVLVLAIVVPYCLVIIADTETDVEINETENPEAQEAADNLFTGVYTGIGRVGTIVNLQFIGLLIAAVMGFGYMVYQRSRGG